MAFYGNPYRLTLVLSHPCAPMCSTSPMHAHVFYLTHTCTCVSSHPCLHMYFISPMQAHVLHLTHTCTCVSPMLAHVLNFTQTCTCAHVPHPYSIRHVLSHPCVHMCFISPMRAHVRTCFVQCFVHMLAPHNVPISAINAHVRSALDGSPHSKSDLALEHLCPPQT